jgi:hypothetical protein
MCADRRLKVEASYIVAQLVVIQGASRGLNIEVKEGRTVLGRSVDCDVVCSDAAASREHAVITCMKGKYYLENKSRNGTYVNKQPLQLTDRFLLMDRDEIQIGNTLMRFVAGLYAGVAWERTNALCGEASDAKMRSIAVLNAGFSPEEIVGLRAQLEKCHVRLDSVDTLAFQRMLEDPESDARRVLTKGFHRLVILDAAHGRDAAGRFNLDTFYRYIVGRLSEIFAVKIPAEAYHDEDVSQCLKDEERSLFCFLNEQEIPTGDLRRLRGFTQGRHRALFVCRSARDLVREEEQYKDGNDWAVESDTSGATLHQSREEKP